MMGLHRTALSPVRVPPYLDTLRVQQIFFQRLSKSGVRVINLKELKQTKKLSRQIFTPSLSSSFTKTHWHNNYGYILVRKSMSKTWTKIGQKGRA